jgi:hypothetical protein
MDRHCPQTIRPVKKDVLLSSPRDNVQALAIRMNISTLEHCTSCLVVSNDA